MTKSEYTKTARAQTAKFRTTQQVTIGKPEVPRTLRKTNLGVSSTNVIVTDRSETNIKSSS